jgi:oligopeptide transport system ATP-binding protein
MTTPLLEVKNLKQYFKVGRGRKKLYVKAVDDLTFDVKKGEVFGIVGESGCGKTTTGRSIIKLYDATDGEVYFNKQLIGAGVQSYIDEIKSIKKQAKLDILKLSPLKYQKYLAKTEYKSKLKALDKKDTDAKSTLKSEFEAKLAKIATEYKDEKPNDEKVQKIKDERDRKVKVLKEKIDYNVEKNALKGETLETMRKIQMIFQDPISSLNPRMTVREIIAEGLIIQGIKDKEYITQKVIEMLNLVGLSPEHAFRYPHEFSGGQRQRIGIARALIVQPELLIADEAISALDVSIQAQVINLLKDLKNAFNLTVIFIAHDLSVVKYFSDRIMVMYFGKAVELAPSDKLFKNPLHPYTQALLSAIPMPNPNSERVRSRVNYNPAVHNYGPDNTPEWIEVEKDHFVLASKKEVEAFKLK